MCEHRPAPPLSCCQARTDSLDCAKSCAEPRSPLNTARWSTCERSKRPQPEAARCCGWLGAAMIVLSDGRRGLAAGLGLVAVGFTAIAWADGAWVGGAFLIIGGAVAVIALLRAGPQDWGIMPAGSTPRLILAVAGGILSLWMAASVTTGPGASLRFASLAVLALMAGRLLQSKA